MGFFVEGKSFFFLTKNGLCVVEGVYGQQRIYHWINAFLFCELIQVRQVLSSLRFKVCDWKFDCER